MDTAKEITREACVGSLEECLQADSLGAQRVELCLDLSVGGVTPSFDDIQTAQEKCQCKISVMIRPRGGNFIYSKEEVETMKQEIEFCKEVKVDGVVFGCLRNDNTVDVALNKELVNLSLPLICTFHMAFDQIQDYQTALQELKEIGFKRILTKGSQTNANDGKERIQQLNILSEGVISIMAGGGVTSQKYKQIIEYTQVHEVHGTKIVGQLN